MKDSKTIYQILVGKLKRFNRHRKFVSLLQGIGKFIVLVVPVWMVLIFLEGWIHLPVAIRVFSVVSAILFSTICLLFLIGSKLYSFFRVDFPPLNRVALTVGQFYKGINDRFANALQMFAKHKQNRENYSHELIVHSLEEVDKAVRDSDFNQFIDRRHAYKWSRSGAAVLILFFCLLALFPSFINPPLFRLAHPLKTNADMPRVQLSVLPGDTTVVKGESVSLLVWTNGEKQHRFHLELTDAFSPSAIPFYASNRDTFQYTIRNVQNALSYRVAGHSPQYKISVVELPLLRQLQVKMIPPPYTRLKATMLEENVAKLSALIGSKIEITGTANKPLKQISIAFKNRDTLKVKAKGARFRTRFTVRQNDQYHFLLQDSLGYKNINPIIYRIKTQVDRSPFVQIIHPGRDIDLSEDMTIPLLIRAEDDYGISKIRLAAQKLRHANRAVDTTQFQFTTLYSKALANGLVKKAHNWDLLSWDMLPNEVMVYYVKAFDNDTINGPKSTRTGYFRARFPSIYEIYKKVAFQQDDAIQSLEGIYEKSRNLKQEIDRLSLQLKRERNVQWQQRQQVNDALVQKEKIQKELDDLSSQVENMVEAMQKNQLVSSPTMEKYRELQDLMDEIMTPELRQVMKNLSKAVEKIDEKMMNRALENISKDEKAFQKRLDRAIELFKRLKLEQQLDQAIKMTENLKAQQKAFQKALQRSEQDLRPQHENALEETKNLESLLNEISEKMSEMEDMPKDSVDKALQTMEERGIKADMQKMLEQISQGKDAGRLQQRSRRIEQSLARMSKQLQSAKKSMSGKQMQKALRAMHKATRDLLQLSHRQENNIEDTRQIGTHDIPHLAKKENDLIQALQRVTTDLFNASKENIFIKQHIGQKLSQAMAHMQTGRDALVERKASFSAQQQHQAMQGLNQAVKALMDNMQQMMKGSGGGMNFEQFMQQMKKLSQMQKGINQQTMDWAQQLGEQAALSRLASQQGQVRKSLQQLARETETMSDVLGDLDQIAKDIEKIEKDLFDKQVDQETIERQQKILSRMLDAQKSIREREFSKKRKAETGKTYTAKRPEALPSELGEKMERLQQDLLRAKKQGFSNDYIELIEQYYRSLSERPDEKK